jgi:hypothetical protein
MRKLTLIVLPLLMPTLSLGITTPNQPVAVGGSEGLTVAAEAHCVASRGIPISEVPDNQVKVACLKDHTVQMACNPDGSHARVEAFRQWTAQMMDFKERCSSVGGSFAYADPNFKEPSDSSFCSLAQPEVQYSEFETPMCNFVSRCPGVAVICSRTEDTLQAPMRAVQLPGVPRAIALAY